MSAPRNHIDAPRWKIIAAFAALYLIWGSTYLGIRFAIETIPPFLMAGWRFFTAGVLLYGWLRLSGAPRPRRIHWKSAAIIGALMLLGGNGGVTWAELRVISSIAALMVALVPLWMVIFDWLGGTPRPRASVIAGLALGVTGMVLLVGPGKLAGSDGVDPIGAAALLLATILWSLGSLYSRNASLPEQELVGTAMEMLTGGLLLILAGTLTGEWARLDLSAISLRSGLAFTYLILIGSIVGFSAYLFLLKAVPPAQASTYAFVNPIVALFLGWAIGGETLSLRSIIAAAIIISGVVLITLKRERQPAPVQSSTD